MSTPFQIHNNTLADYLAWLKANALEFDPSVQPPVFTWRGNDYSCNFSWTEQKYLNQGGYVPEHNLVLEVLEPMPVVRDDGQQGPALKELVTFQGKDFRVEIIKRAFGKNPQLICWDPSRGV